MLHIATFQEGFPHNLDRYVWVRRSNLDDQGLLPRLAIRDGDFALLQRVYKLRNSLPLYYSTKKAISFSKVLEEAVRFGEFGIVEWLVALPARVEHTTPGALWDAAIENGSIDAVEWVLKLHPGLLESIDERMLCKVARHGNFALLKLLETRVTSHSATRAT